MASRSTKRMHSTTPHILKTVLGVVSAALLPSTTFGATQTTIFELHGSQTDCCSVSGSAGDLNQDGVNDWFVGGGFAFGLKVQSGHDGSPLLGLLPGPDLVIPLEDVTMDSVIDYLLFRNGAPAVAYSGSTGALIYQGPSLPLLDATLGPDLNGDGSSDVLLLDDGPTQEHLAAYSATDGLLIWSRPVFPPSGLLSGHLANLGSDLNGDGLPDFVLSSRGQFGSGSGAFNSEFLRAASSLDGSSLWEVLLSRDTDVVSVADQDGDGIRDLIITAIHAFPDNGHSLSLRRGVDGSLIRAFGPQFPFGEVLEVLGDIDGDGTEDLAIGLPAATNQLGEATGSVTVVSLATGSVLWTIFGEAPGEGFGVSLGALDDITGDGVPDLIVGTSGGGVARVLSGAPLPGGLAHSVGAGCDSAGIVPALSLTGPVIGHDLTAFLSSAHSTAPAILLFSSIPSSPTVLPSGCTVFVGPDRTRFASGVTSGTGTWVLSQSVPYIPSLIGLEFAMQAVVLGPPRYQLSNGIHILIGVR